MSRNFKARIDENRKLHKTHNLLTISPLSPIPRFEPGQFLMIGLDRGCDPLLRRPFSVLRAGPNGHQILYRIRGKGTMILSALQEGSTVDVIGPVGNQYPLPAQGMTPLLVAGGIGIASLFSLAERLSQKAYIFYGARTGDEIFLLDDLMRMPRELHLSTEDGSLGEKGFITGVLERYLSRQLHPHKKYVIYACGPPLMIKRVGEIAEEKGIASYASLEENMACGIGACLGCVVRTVSGYQRVCKEGPVFPIRQIVW